MPRGKKKKGKVITADMASDMKSGLLLRLGTAQQHEDDKMNKTCQNLEGKLDFTTNDNSHFETSYM